MHSEAISMHSEAISMHSSDRRMSITCDQPALIRGNQRSSVAIRGHQWQSEVISGNQRSSVATCDQSALIRGHQWSSVAIRGHKLAISGNQTHLGIRAKVNIRGN
jgi:hypothetical protein